MTQPITSIGDEERQIVNRIRAVQVVSDDQVESWELELLGERPARCIATDSYSLTTPSKHEDVLDLISYVLASVGLRAGSSTLANSSQSDTEFTLPVSQAERT